jgi:predicted PurR-regulated permease PerM
MQNSQPPQPYETPRWSVTTRYLAGILLIALIILAALLLGSLLRVLFLTFVFAFIVYIPARGLNRWAKVPYRVGVLLMIVLLILLLVFGVLLMIPASLNAINGIVHEVVELFKEIDRLLRELTPNNAFFSFGGLNINFFSMLRPAQELVESSPSIAGISVPQIGIGDMIRTISTLGTTALSAAVAIIGSLAAVVAQIFFALVLAMFILLDLDSSAGLLRRTISPRYQREVALLLTKIDEAWINFMRGQLVISGIFIVVTYVELTLLGVHHAPVLALFSGTMALIPNIGGVIAAIPIIMTTLLYGSWRFPDLDPVTFTVIQAVINLVYSQAIYIFIAPKIIGKQTQLPTFIVVLGMFVGLIVGGIAGALLVVPLLGTIKVLSAYTMAKIADREPFPDEPIPPDTTKGFFSQLYFDGSDTNAHGKDET